MPRYDFRCSCGEQITLMFSMAVVPNQITCDICTGEARRIMSAPHLGRSSSAAFQAIDRSARSAHEPQVVTGPLPGRGSAPRPAFTSNPLHAKLPRS